MVESSFVKLDHVLKNRKIRLDLRMRILDCHGLPILTYRCEAWASNSQIIGRIEATEIWFYRRMIRISYSQHISNEEVLRKVEARRNVIRNIRKRQLKFKGHVLRKRSMENLYITGFIDDN